MALTLVIALGTGFPIYLRLFFLMVLVMASSWVWAFLNLKGVHVTIQRSFGNLQVGDSLESQVAIHNSSPIPKFGIEIEELSELPGHTTGVVVDLPPHKELRLALKTPLRKRGIYRVGAPIALSGDPFGVFRLRRREAGSQQLIVLPHTVDIPPFSPAQGELVGEGVIQRGSPVSTVSVATVREYQPGESSRHLHWPSTARRGSLMLKQFDGGLEDMTWILLDLQGEVHAGEEVENTEEYAITAAASIARNYSERGWAVGLLAQGDRLYALPPLQDAPALDRLLLALTEARAQGSIGLRELLTLWRSQIASLAVSLVVVTPSTDPGWSPLLESMMRQGVSTTAVIVDPHSFGGEGDPHLLLSQLDGRGIPTHLLRKGEDISQALQRPWRFSPGSPIATGTDGAET